MPVIKSTLSYLQSLVPDCGLPNRSTLRSNEDGYSNELCKAIIHDFVGALDYKPPAWRGVDPDISATPTYKALLSDFSVYSSGDGWIEATCLSSAAYGEIPYPDHSPELRLQIAKFTWYLLYIDDLGHKAPSVLKAFQENLFKNKTVEESPLQGFRDNLAMMYKFWDTIAADCITTSGMEFLTGRLIEIDSAIRDMKATTITSSWPEFLREKNGAAAAYAFMIYPLASGVDISTYIQAMEDMKFVIKYSNDLLSFYKETLAGESDNYIHNRARATRKSIPETLRDVANEVVAAHLRVNQVLHATKAYNAWKSYADGNLDFYFSAKRYRLSELGF